MTRATTALALVLTPATPKSEDKEWEQFMKSPNVELFVEFNFNFNRNLEQYNDPEIIIPLLSASKGKERSNHSVWKRVVRGTQTIVV